MEDLREEDIFASKFWEGLREHSPGAGIVSYLHGLFLLFLVEDARSDRLREAIVRQIWMLDDPGNSEAAADEFLREAPIFFGLESGADETYSRRYKRAYKGTLAVLRAPNELPLELEPKTILYRQQYEYVSKWSQNVESTRLLHTFDYGYSALLKATVDGAREAFGSSLAVSCASGRSVSIADLYSPTARFVRQFAERHMSKARCHINGSLTTQFTAMRLHMQGVAFDYVLPSEEENVALALTQAEFILLDPNPAANTIAPYWNSAQIRQPKYESAIELADKLCNSPKTFGMALLVVPQADCRAKGGLSAVRSRLVDQGRIAAVIDFPRSASDENRNFTAWLISGTAGNDRARDEHILFIDAQPLARLTSRYDAGVTADFIGALVAGMLQHTDTQFDLIHRLEKSEPLLASIFAREFSPTDFEAPGLSRLVPIDEVRKRGCTLMAKPYLMTPTEDNWSRGIRRQELDEVLGLYQIPGKRIYLIGNNGEGKSLLLGDISREMVRKKRRTIVIAFGATDRFPKNFSRAAGASYLYLGARTTTAGINAVQTAITIGGLMLRIYADEQRLKVFEQILHLVGFASRQYLIPKEFKANTPAADRLLRGVVMLSATDADDRALIQRLRENPINARQYKLGLRRIGSRDSILPFDELSSGEQQIILLIAKITSEATHNALFIIDEPEISLHVAWQNAVPKLLQIIAEEFAVDILVATHSPVIVTSAGDRRDYCFTIRDRLIEQLSVNDRRSVETALFEGFRTYTAHNREVHERCASLVAEVIGSINSEARDDQSTLSVLAKLDDMTAVIRRQSIFAEQDDLDFDLLLVERAKAAVEEMVASAPAQRGSE